MRKTVLRLDDEQKMVCVAIMEIDRRKRSRTFIEPGASAGEIAAYFTKRDENVPPLLEQTLADLSRRNPPVLAAASYGGRGPFYQVRF